MAENYIGVDVWVFTFSQIVCLTGILSGTGSVRASLVRRDGQILALSTHNIITFRDTSDHKIFEQSTTDIWNGIVASVRACLAIAKVDPSTVKGLGFDATCSLVVSDEHGKPVTITKGSSIGQPGERNVILWADHRAEKEADTISKSGSIVLNYVGGTMSVCSEQLYYHTYIELTEV
jgi:ribulose kinase